MILMVETISCQIRVEAKARAKTHLHDLPTATSDQSRIDVPQIRVSSFRTDTFQVSLGPLFTLDFSVDALQHLIR